MKVDPDKEKDEEKRARQAAVDEEIAYSNDDLEDRLGEEEEDITN